jgi:hypothetical protein
MAAIVPYLEVEPRRYRFRLLNAANGRFFHLSLSNGQQFLQIGADQGLMASPVELASFVIAPGERVVLNSDAFQMMQFRIGKGPVRDSSSVEFKSPTGDSMTMPLGGNHWNHLHLVCFQIPDRRSFDEPLYFRTRQMRPFDVVPPEKVKLTASDGFQQPASVVRRDSSRRPSPVDRN